MDRHVQHHPKPYDQNGSNKRQKGNKKAFLFGPNVTIQPYDSRGSVPDRNSFYLSGKGNIYTIVDIDGERTVQYYDEYGNPGGSRAAASNNNSYNSSATTNIDSVMQKVIENGTKIDLIMKQLGLNNQ